MDCRSPHSFEAESESEARGVSEHYPKHFDEANEFCSVCHRVTKHRVSGGRLAHCLEHEAPLYSKAQLAAREKRKREQVNPSLFAWPPGDAA